MTHHIDDEAWPLLQLTQSGRLTVSDATALTDALTAAIGRARDGGHRFVALLDFRDRRAPERGANEVTAAFFAQHTASLAEHCAGMATVVTDDKLVAAAGRDDAGLPGLTTLTTLDEQHARQWLTTRTAPPVRDSTG